MRSDCRTIRWVLLGVNVLGLIPLSMAGWSLYFGESQEPEIHLVQDASTVAVEDTQRHAYRRVANYDSIVLALSGSPPPEPETETAAESELGSDEPEAGGPLGTDWEVAMTLGPEAPRRRRALLRKKEDAASRTTRSRTVRTGRTRSSRRYSSRRIPESVLVCPGEVYELDEGQFYAIERVTGPPVERVFYEFGGESYVLVRVREWRDPRLITPERDPNASMWSVRPEAPRQ